MSTALLTISRPLNRLTAERMEQAGVVQAQRADNAHHRHILADWTRRTAYLAAVARGDVRRDLDGHPNAAPDAHAGQFAAVMLSRRGVAR